MRLLGRLGQGLRHRMHAELSPGGTQSTFGFSSGWYSLGSELRRQERKRGRESHRCGCPLTCSGVPVAHRSESPLWLQDFKCWGEKMSAVQERKHEPRMGWTRTQDGLDANQGGLDTNPGWAEHKPRVGWHKPSMDWTRTQGGLDTNPGWAGHEPRVGWTRTQHGLDTNPGWAGMNPGWAGCHSKLPRADGSECLSRGQA